MDIVGLLNKEINLIKDQNFELNGRNINLQKTI